MLLPDPRYLRELLTRYAELRIAQARGERACPEALADVAYTLCVATGTRRIDDALAAADRMLAAHKAGGAAGVAAAAVPAQPVAAGDTDDAVLAA
ncbi:DUF5133 domain-containing protein [Streptomyces sp. ODS05-4]|uniref:DUF5133 domain-containing protein n=1 Tax=Streptomyces sp. ODS05-4 TaxID=2944939 RepID=UPI00210D4B08|nr:DUF5133 domain-containing protein [Streptomyces sp. ODS05-4]